MKRSERGVDDSGFEWAEDEPPVRPRRRRLTRTQILVRRSVAAGALLAALAILAAVIARSNGGDSAARTSALREPVPVQHTPSARTGLVGDAAVALRQGDRGPAVRELQEELARVGFDPGTPDGAFGAGTREAVIAFQRAHGLDADGIFGAETALALAEADPAGPESATDPNLGPYATAAVRGLDAAVRAGRLERRAAQRYRAIVVRASGQLDDLPSDAATGLAAVFEVVANHAASYNDARAHALFTMLDANARHLAANRIGAERDVVGADGVVYRYTGDYAYQFHPLANFAELNRLVSIEDRERARRLARALVQRGVPDGDALVWEYYFPFGGPVPWRSGFAQAIAAQSLARAARLTGFREAEAAAKSALNAIPNGLSLPVGGATWIREYGFSDLPILNAQLQSLVSLDNYAKTTGDADARQLVDGLERASLAVLREFDTGCWSRYSLGGADASLSYHTYHVQLLRKLALIKRDPLWREVRDRWSRYLERRNLPCAERA